VAYGVTRGEHGQVEMGSQKAADTLSNALTKVHDDPSGAPDEADRPALVPASVVRLTVPISVATLFSEIPLPLEHLGRGDHLLVAAGVLLERGPCASFTGHELHSLST
jgi:hypothetical protein